MADQNGGRNGPYQCPRQAIVPPSPSAGYRQRAETLRGRPAAPGPLIAPPAPAPKSPERPAEQRTRPTEIELFLRALEEKRRRGDAQQGTLGPAQPIPTFPDPETYFMMRRMSGGPDKRRLPPMEWDEGMLERMRRTLVSAAPSLPSTPTLMGMPAARVPQQALSGVREPKTAAAQPRCPKPQNPEPSRAQKEESARLWRDASLPTVGQKKPAQGQKEEPPDIKKRLDRWCLSLDHPAKEVLLNSLIEDTVSAFSGLKHASREGQRSLEIICAGGRPPFIVESAVGAPVGTVSDQFLKKLGEMKAKGLLSDAEAKAFIDQFVRFVFYSQQPAEAAGMGEVEMRNGFFRAVAWCICVRTSPPLFSEFFSRNRISLLDAVGIAVGLNSDDARKVMGEGGVRTALYQLMKKRWVATGYEHLKELLRVDMARGRLDARAVSRFITIILREVGEYQRIVQSYSILARNMCNLSRRGEEHARKVMYMSEGRFIRYLMLRGSAPDILWRAVGKMHAFIAKLFAGRGGNYAAQDEFQYAAGRSPMEIADIFSTVLEGLDFLTQDKRMRRIALEAIQHYGIGSWDVQPDSFKKLFALCLFTRARDICNYPALYRSLLDYSNPIVSDIALDYAAYLLARELDFLFPIEEASETRPTLTPEDLRQVFDEEDAPF